MSKESSLQSLFDVSVPVADAILRWANVFLILGGITTVVMTVVVIWVTGVRERYADERISANEVMTAQATSDAADARERAAGIERENLRLQTRLEAERTARLRLQEQISPRRLSSEQREGLVRDLAPFRGQKVRVLSPHSTEGNEFALDFIEVFKRAGWEVMEAATSTGVAFVEYDIDPRGLQLAVAPEDPPQVHQAAQALVVALAKQKLRDPLPVGLPIDLPNGGIEFGVGVKPTQSGDEPAGR